MSRSSTAHLKVAVLLSVHAYPDPAIGSRRISEFARHLRDQGWQVHLIAQAGPFARTGGALAPGVMRHDIEFPAPLSRFLTRLIPSVRGEVANTSTGTTRPGGAGKAESARRSLVSRLRDWARFHYFRYTVCVDNYKRWSLRAARRVSQLIGEHRPAAVFASGPPFSPLVPTALIARLRRTRFIMDLRDPWLALDPANPREYAGFRRRLDALLERLCVALAAHVVTTSQRLSEQLRARHPRHANKIVTIRNGYEHYMLMDPPQPTGRLVMLYAGTIYLHRNPLPFFEALERLAASGRIDAQRVSVTFVGDCRRWQDLNLDEWLAERGLDSMVTLRDPVAPAEVASLTREANVLINFAQQQHDSVPAKLFEQIASRRQVLLFTEADSESALAAGASPQVVRVDSHPEEIEAAILRLYDQWVNGRSALVHDDAQISAMARQRTNEQLEQLLVQLHEGEIA